MISLAEKYPELAKEWNYEKNKGLKDGNDRDISTPDNISPGSGRKVWWICKYGHEYETTVAHRTGMHSNCPYCSKYKISTGFNDLSTINPNLAKEWNYEKNKGLSNKRGYNISTPDKIAAGSKQKVWWKLPYDVPDDYPVVSLRGKHFDFEWKASVKERNNGSKCPFLSGHQVWPGFNDLATVNPKLAKQWHPTKNGDLKPTNFTYGSTKGIWWKCPKGHEWEAQIYRRRSNSCPYCSENKSRLFSNYPNVKHIIDNYFEIKKHNKSIIVTQKQVYEYIESLKK